MIISDAMKFPALQTSKSIVSFYGQDRKQYKLDIVLHDLASKLSKIINIDEYKRKRMLSTLKTVGINETPEKYIASVWIKTLLPIIISIPISLILPITFPLTLVLAVRIYFKEIRIADERLIKEREKIEYEMPRFTRDISENLKSTRDVLGILERYKKTAGDSLRRELDITIADMKTGNYETALTRFETRIQSPMLSDVVRGLISVIRGDNSLVYFQLLSHDFKALELQRLKHEANKRPGKIKKYSFLMLACILLIYIVVIGISVVRGIGGMF
jgi:pilus assembly protein TadC